MLYTPGWLLVRLLEMIYLRLAPQEALDLLRVLVEAGEKKVSSRLESELVETLECLDKIDKERSSGRAQAWLKRQSDILKRMEEE